MCIFYTKHVAHVVYLNTESIYTSAQEVTLQKYFSTSTFSYLLFRNQTYTLKTKTEEVGHYT